MDLVERNWRGAHLEDGVEAHLTVHRDSYFDVGERRRSRHQAAVEMLHLVTTHLEIKGELLLERELTADFVGATSGDNRVGSHMRAQVHAYHSIAENIGNISCGDSVETAASTSPAMQQPPAWLGTPLPPTEVLEAEAARLIDNHITAIRAKVIESEDGETLPAEVKNLFDTSLPGPNSVEEYVASLNGDGGEWAERVLREATPFAPVSPFAGKPRFRRLLVMTSGATNSIVFRNVREALPDQALQIVAREHPQTDVLCLEDEWGLCAGEFSEVAELIKDFRSLPPEQQALLCTACDPADLRSFFPELPEDHARPVRLLSSARVFNVIQRSGSEDYKFDQLIIVKGYRAALQALTLRSFFGRERRRQSRGGCV